MEPLSPSRPTMWRVLVLVLFLGLAACTERPPSPFKNVDITGAEFGHSLQGFRDHHGNPATLTDFKGKVVLIFFGYTFCPDICPTALSRFATVMKLLGPDAERVQVLFVSLDPERDTPEQLAGYVPWFYPSFIGLTGSVAATEAAAREFKVYYAKHPGSEASTYLIDHSAGAYVIDAAGKIRIYLKDGAPVEDVVSDLQRLLMEK